MMVLHSSVQFCLWSVHFWLWRDKNGKPRESFIGRARAYVANHQSGATLPTLPSAARRIVDGVIGPQTKRAAELGAGNGEVTVQILQRMPPDGRLDAFEVDPTCVDHLEELGETDKYRRLHVHRRGIAVMAEVLEDDSLDAVVDGLPYSHGILPDELKEEAMLQSARALKPQGVKALYNVMTSAQWWMRACFDHMSSREKFLNWFIQYRRFLGWGKKPPEEILETFERRRMKKAAAWQQQIDTWLSVAHLFGDPLPNGKRKT